jgi:hypothetical protein
MKQETPRLTAAVVIGRQRVRAARCIELVLAQRTAEPMEVVVVDLAPEHPSPPWAKDGRVRLIERRDSPTYAEARAAATLASRGELIAFLEDHSYPEPGWAQAIVDAFADPRIAIVNYAFTLANEPTYIARAMLVAEYGRWMAPARPGAVRIPACNNIAYRRAALEPYRVELAEWLEAEFLLHRRIRDAGGQVWLAPGARLAHECWTDLISGCRANGAMKRLLAASRIRTERWSAPKRLLYAAAMAAAPAQALWRLARSVPGRPGMWSELARGLPVCIAIYSWSAAAEAAGYLFGPGSARDDFRDVELAMTRH